MKFTPRRTGMTLMEIMMSVMILGLGLLGILSVIPFIEFHSARVVESDFTAAAGTNAFAVIQSNQWEKPANWVYSSSPNPGEPDFRRDFRCPRLLDVFGEGDVDFTTKRDITYTIRHIYPNVDGEINQDDYRGQDDIVVERDENSPTRPQLLFDRENASGRAEFTGAYSWAALMTPVTSDPGQSYTNVTFPGYKGVIDDEIPRAEIAMKVDVLVFRGRDPGDQDCLPEEIVEIGSGYLGGLVHIDCNNSKPTEFEKSLTSSTHILLIGPSDQQAYDINAPFFSAWYKISNFSRNGSRFAVTLSGPSFPACWRGENAGDWTPNVCAVLFRNLRGVFSRVIPVTELE